MKIDIRDCSLCVYWSPISRACTYILPGWAIAAVARLSAASKIPVWKIRTLDGDPLGCPVWKSREDK